MNWHGKRVIIWKISLVFISKKIFNEQEGMSSKEGGMNRKTWAGRHGQYSVVLKWCSNEESMPEPMSLEDKCENQIALFRIQTFQ